MKINNISQINYSVTSVISFDATVIEVTSDGDEEKKKPIKIVFKLEDSGDLLNGTTWKFEYLDQLKEAVTTDAVFEVTGQAGNFGNFGDQFRMGTFQNLNRKSAIKIVKTIDSSAMKRETETIINTYIPKGSLLYPLVAKLILENPKFWEWPAAEKIHHAYEGGLAKHSLNVCKNAINIWKNYEGSNCDISVIVAGALLHDIGKLQEYKKDGSRTVYGNLVPHPVSGYAAVFKLALELGIDPEKDTKLIMLLHIILSHHEKREYGAPTTPNILEAFIVAKADALDAVFETADKTLDNMTLNSSSEMLKGLDGARIFKWH